MIKFVRLLAFLLLAACSTRSAEPTPGHGFLAPVREYLAPEDLLERGRVTKVLRRLVAGEEAGRSWVRPFSLAFDNGRMAVCDAGERTVWLAGKGHLARLAPPGGFLSPVDVAFGDGILFVSDSAAGTVWSVDLDTRRWVALPGGGVRPTGLHYSSARAALLIADTATHRVLAWDGGAMKVLAERGLNFPTDVCEGPDGTIAVADSLDHQIDFRDGNGRPVRTLGQAGDGFGTFSSLRGLVCDGRGRLFATDVQRDWIQVFSWEGKLLFVYGGPGTLDHPAYPALGRGRLWVADAFRRRIIQFEIQEDLP